VVAEFLRKIIGGSAAPSAAVQSTLDELHKLGATRPSLAGPIGLVSAILPLLFEELTQEAVPVISPDHAAAKLAGGVPLLRGEKVVLDGKALKRRWQRICAAIQPHQPDDLALSLAESVRQGRLNLGELANSVLAGRPEDVHARAQALGLDAALIATVLRFTLMPALARLHARLEPVSTGCRWERGSCPTCGSWPLLGEYRGLEQTRWLRCGLCTAAWTFPRLECPYCAASDHQTLGYFSVQGEEEKYRAATCDACRGYVKMISTLNPLDGTHLVAADVATLHLDLAAAERGFRN
jgi:FdhE protein